MSDESASADGRQQTANSIQHSVMSELLIVNSLLPTRSAECCLLFSEAEESTRQESQAH
jgi:hypothetical protein